MTVMPSLLDRRLVLYEPQDGGADGFVRTIYCRTGTWWGRLDATGDVEQVPLSPQAHSEYRTAGAATVADYVPVPLHGIVKDTLDNALYFVRGVVLLRALRCQRLTLEHISPTNYGTYTLYDDVDVLDGEHLVSNRTAFSTAFAEPEFR